MDKSKKFRMPAGIRNKLTAAIAMLLVSCIMMVSSTYAWFTLSTAPEVTGITTSVGANGNLEMALLNGQTYADMTKIGSSVGDSSAVKDVNLANVTWGNLVDLSTGYGLNDIALMPAALNATYTTGEDSTQTLTGVNVTNPLNTAEYGADGRVANVDVSTVSAVLSGGAFAYGETQTYGVRAIGTTSSLSAREIALRNAKSAVNTTASVAKTATKNAIGNNMGVLFAYATGDTTTVPTSYTNESVIAFRAIANAVVADLTTLENGYKNAAIAYAAANTSTDEAFATTKATIEAMTLSDLITNAGTYGLTTLTTGMTGLNTALTDAKAAQTTLSAAVALGTEVTAATTTTATQVNDAIKQLIGGIVQDGTDVYITEAAVGQLGAQVGTYVLASVGGIGTVYAGVKDNATGSFASVVTAVSGLKINESGSTTTNITDTYGYIIDFAFRTNASGSNLQLQTSAVNRVYSDQTNADLATQGSGSTVTYVYASGMTTEQVNKLLSAVKLVFLNTTNGTVYATAGLTDIVVGTTEATANVKLSSQAADANVGTITALEQNVATAISVLVYLDGNMVDNSAVINAQNSGMLNLNLQFSSSAELIPMQNTALEQMTAYTVSFNANTGTGFMQAVKASGEYAVPANAFTAPTGKQFKGWAKTATISADTELVTTLTLEGNVTLYAIWEDAPQTPVQPTTYTVTLPESGVTGDATVAAGATYNFTVNPATCELDEVTMGGAAIEPTNEGYNNYSIENVTGDIVINVIKKYTVTFKNVSGGELSLGSSTHTPGTEVTVTAVPETGYKFSSMTYTVEGGQPVTVDGLTFTMPEGNVTIEGTFVQE